MTSNGLKETLAAMERVKRVAKEAAMQRLIKGAQEVADAARQLAPEDEGDLKASIVVTEPGQTTPPHSQPGGSRAAGENEVLVTAGNSDVRYPHHVEHGTVKMEAQPYFFPAYRLLRDKVRRSTAAAFGRAARKEWNR
jgi:HK97 gp10 family phage protein